MTEKDVGSPQWLNHEEQAAWRALLRMHAQLSAQLNRELTSDAGLSLQDYAVLVALTDQPEGMLRPFELGHVLGWEKSRLSHHISRMTDRGLVRRESCPTDQRGSFIVITGPGRKAIEAAAPGHAAAVRRLFVDPLTPTQMHLLCEIADRVIRASAEA